MTTHREVCVRTSPKGSNRPAVCRNQDGRDIPCVKGGAVWFLEHDCYATRAGFLYFEQPGDPGPPWFGRTDGQIWQCRSEGADDFAAFMFGSVLPEFWVPDGDPRLPVDGATVAREVLSSMILTAPALEISPNPTAVGFSTWLSVDPAGFTTLTDGTTLGATTVSVVATPVATRWNLDGTTVDCDGPGERRPEGTHPRDASSCSHMFEASSRDAPDGLPGSATITYEVEWTCEGVCMEPSGTLERTQGRVATTDVVVHELAAQLVR